MTRLLHRIRNIEAVHGSRGLHGKSLRELTDAQLLGLTLNGDVRNPIHKWREALVGSIPDSVLKATAEYFRTDAGIR